MPYLMHSPCIYGSTVRTLIRRSRRSFRSCVFLVINIVWNVTICWTHHLTSELLLADLQHCSSLESPSICFHQQLFFRCTSTTHAAGLLCFKATENYTRFIILRVRSCTVQQIPVFTPSANFILRCHGRLTPASFSSLWSFICNLK